MPERARRRPAAHSDIPVASPCIRQCCLDDTGTCLGCFRTITEIMAWGRSSNAAKRDIVTRVAMRRQRRGRD